MIANTNPSVALGWQLLQAGNLAGADETVRPLLAGGLRDELVPLVGAIRLQQGRFSEAAPLFERARAIHPTQARFAFLHGNALAGLQQLDQAMSAWQAAIRQEPNFADPYLALGRAQRKLGQQHEALNTYRKLLRVQPSNVDGYIALGSVLAEMGQFAEAEAPLRRALQHTQDAKVLAAIHNNLAIVLSNQSRHAEALESLDRTQSLAPDLPSLDQRRIDRLHQLGRYDECLVLYRELLDRNPADAALHRAYNSLLYRLGRKDEFLASYDRAPQTREILLGKAWFLSRQKRTAEVEEIYNTILARDPLDGAALAGWAGNLMVLGQHREALAAFETIITRRGASPGVFSAAAGAALMIGDPEKAEELCHAGLRSDPFDQTCLALLGLAWRMKDDERDEGLNGYGSLVRVFDLKPPEGFSSMESFNAELGTYLDKLHPRTDAYLEQSLHGGTQTEGMLFGAGHALVEKLRVRIEETIANYIANLPTNDHHPFLMRRAKSFRFTGAWSCLMRGQGRHVNHLHPEGWISSAYYVTVPEATKDAETKNGWIKFGEPSLDLPLKEPIRRAVQPIPGRLVLFPSYVWHGTVPLQASSARTTIAFDAVPR
ncbi:MAG TPA: tetratricopeptide repeat protein [Rhizomicrobium sp.]|nr:tetratricopeptide repeat protein [Rhizomicrobium sp.]